MTLGAFAGGCRAVFAYPITPASEVLETATKVFPKFGGVAVQMEDELSALAACVGANFAGVRAMTATAGPCARRPCAASRGNDFLACEVGFLGAGLARGESPALPPVRPLAAVLTAAEAPRR